MTRLHAGGKFGGGSYAATGGLHGVGASVVNALSARLDVEVDRDGRTHLMSFRRGMPGQFTGDGPDAAFVETSELAVSGKVPRGTYRHPDAVLAGPTGLPAGRRDRARRAVRPGAADGVPRAGAGVRGDRRAVRRGRRGAVPVRRRDQRVLQLSGARRAGQPGAAAAGHRALPGDRPGPRRPGTHGPHQGRPRADRRRRRPVGDRLRHRAPLVRQHHRDAQGRHPRPRLREGAARHLQHPAPGAAGAARSRGRGRHRRRPRGRHRGGDRAVGGAAVRGPDQGGPRHLGGLAHRGRGGQQGADRGAHRAQARGQGAGQDHPRQGRRRDAHPRSRCASTRSTSAARTPSSPPRCRPS